MPAFLKPTKSWSDFASRRTAGVTVASSIANAPKPTGSSRK